jgi:hypothetical protein
VLELHDLGLFLEVLRLVGDAAVEVAVGDVGADHGGEAVLDEVTFSLLRGRHRDVNVSASPVQVSGSGRRLQVRRVELRQE